MATDRQQDSTCFVFLDEQANTAWRTYLGIRFLRLNAQSFPGSSCRKPRCRRAVSLFPPFVRIHAALEAEEGGLHGDWEEGTYYASSR